ncbi:MAG: hypothetical protein ACE5EK_02990, partial [Nitrospinales bacterium]
CILSLKMALGERENNVEKEQKMFNLWKTTCKGEELLPEPLQVFCEIWRTLFDDEIRSFQGVFDHRGFAVKTVHGISGRVNRLKQLGNAVVPQIVEIIGRAIMQVEQE